MQHTLFRNFPTYQNNNCYIDTLLIMLFRSTDIMDPFFFNLNVSKRMHYKQNKKMCVINHDIVNQNVVREMLYKLVQLIRSDENNQTNIQFNTSTFRKVLYDLWSVPSEDFDFQQYKAMNLDTRSKFITRNLKSVDEYITDFKDIVEFLKFLLGLFYIPSVQSKRQVTKTVMKKNKLIKKTIYRTNKPYDPVLLAILNTSRPVQYISSILESKSYSNVDSTDGKKTTTLLYFDYPSLSAKKPVLFVQAQSENSGIMVIPDRLLESDDAGFELRSIAIYRNAHYVCYYKDMFDEKWYFYNDIGKKVELVGTYYELLEYNNKEVQKRGVLYLYILKKI